MSTGSCPHYPRTSCLWRYYHNHHLLRIPESRHARVKISCGDKIINYLAISRSHISVSAPTESHKHQTTCGQSQVLIYHTYHLWFIYYSFCRFELYRRLIDQVTHGVAQVGRTRVRVRLGPDDEVCLYCDLFG